MKCAKLAFSRQSKKNLSPPHLCEEQRMFFSALLLPPPVLTQSSPAELAPGHARARTGGKMEAGAKRENPQIPSQVQR